MAVIPQGVLTPPLSGLTLVARGKVRDTYEIVDGLLLVVASDRISIFDFVLNATVKDKGAILCALNHFWRTTVFADWEQDIVATGSAIDKYLPENLRGNVDLQSRAVVVKNLVMADYEFIVRGYLVGSSVKPYRKNRKVCGHLLPEGLVEGSKLECPIFTPTSKAKEGHDLHVTVQEVIDRYGQAYQNVPLVMYEKARMLAMERGVVLVDTKFEFGVGPDGPIIADEILTPDSTRYWDYNDYLTAKKDGKLPKSFDKQFVRDWGLSVGINSDLDPEDPATQKLVHSKVPPSELLDKTTMIYHEILMLITGKGLCKYQAENMGIVN